MKDTMALSLGDERLPALELAFGILRESWEGFDWARPGQPPPSEQTLALLSEPLPVEGIGALAALREAEMLLDESLAQSRPRFFGYVGSSGLEVGVLAASLSAAHDVNLASVAAAATMVERQTIGWVGEFVGFGRTGGVVTSGGMVSNLTALTAARERALPGSRRAGLDGRGTLYVSAEAHSSINRSAEILGVGSESVRAILIDADRGMDVEILAAPCTPEQSSARTCSSNSGSASARRQNSSGCRESPSVACCTSTPASRPTSRCG